MIFGVVQAEAFGLVFAFGPLASPTGQHIRRGDDRCLFTCAHIRILVVHSRPLSGPALYSGLLCGRHGQFLARRVVVERGHFSLQRQIPPQAGPCSTAVFTEPGTVFVGASCVAI